MAICGGNAVAREAAAAAAGCAWAAAWMAVVAAIAVLRVVAQYKTTAAAAAEVVGLSEKASGRGESKWPRHKRCRRKRRG